MIVNLQGKRVAFLTLNDPNHERHGIFMDDDDDFICIAVEDGPLAGATVYFQSHAFYYIREAP